MASSERPILEQKVTFNPLVSTIKKEEDEYDPLTDFPIIASSEQKHEVEQDPLAATVKEEPIDDPLTDFEIIVPEGQLLTNEEDPLSFDPLEEMSTQSEELKSQGILLGEQTIGEVSHCRIVDSVNDVDKQTYMFLDFKGNSSNETHLKNEPSKVSQKQTKLITKSLILKKSGKCFTLESKNFSYFRSDSGIEIFKCKECSKAFPQQRDLIKHRARHHLGIRGGEHLAQMDLAENSFKCSSCGKCFEGKTNLVYHNMRMHCGEKNVKCKTLAENCSRKDQPTRHTTIFSCYDCSQTFVRKFDLINHVRAHLSKKIALGKNSG